MVTSVSGNSLAALTARESAQANRTNGSQNPPGRQDEAQVRDPAVVYAGASDAPSISAILNVQDSLGRAAGISDVGISAGQTIGDLLGLLREKAVAAQDAATPDARGAINADFQQLLRTIDQIAGSASFQGVKVIDGSSGDHQFKADVSGETQLSISPQDFTTGGPVLALAGADLLGSQDDLAGVLGRVDLASANLGQQVAGLKARSEQIQAHLGVIGQLQGAVDGQGTTQDLDAESARLQALQVQQLLAGQTDGVANQAPQALLALFRA